MHTRVITLELLEQKWGEGDPRARWGVSQSSQMVSCGFKTVKRGAIVDTPNVSRISAHVYVCTDTH